MKAIEVVEDQLLWNEHPDPEAPSGREVRIRVAAAGVNRADLVQRAGRYPPPPGASTILGLEVSGIVEEAGPEAGLAVGAPVCALLTGGGYAEQVVVDERCCLPVPSGVSLIDAAGLCEVWATAWLNLVIEGGMGAGDRVVVHAGASGVGTAAVQIARLQGARAFVTVGSAEKVARCTALGAEGGWNRHDGDWADAVRAWAEEADLILDPVGAPYLAQAQQVLATEGRWVLIGLMGGRRAEIDLGRLLVKRQRLIGSTLRSRTVPAKEEVLRQLQRVVWPALASGEVQAVISSRLPMHDAGQAHELLASNETVGKVLLIPQR